jgi:hypothetical protein
VTQLSALRASAAYQIEAAQFEPVRPGSCYPDVDELGPGHAERYSSPVEHSYNSFVLICNADSAGIRVTLKLTPEDPYIGLKWSWVLPVSATNVIPSRGQAGSRSPIGSGVLSTNCSSLPALFTYEQ